MFPVRGDVRLVDGNETLVFTGSQKAISWLNKIFSSLHESSLPTRLQKHSRRSSSAPCGTTEYSPGEFTHEHPGDALNTKVVRRPTSREKSPRHSPRSGVKKARAAWGSQPPSPTIRDHPTSLSRQKKTFLRGKRPTTSSPRDSTISSRAKSCERVVRPKSTGILSPNSPQQRKLPSSLVKSAPSLSTSTLNSSHGTDSCPPTPERFSITPRRVRSRERPCRAAWNNSQPSESLSTVSTTDNAEKVQLRGRRRPPLSPPDVDRDESPKLFRNERPISERMKALSTSPFSPWARMTISSANRRRPPVGSPSLVRRFSCTPPKLTSIPELLMQRPGTPLRPSSPQVMEHKRPWDYTESPTDSTPPELETSYVNSPKTPGESPTSVSLGPSRSRSPPRSSPPKTSIAVATGRPITPIESDFLRSTPGAAPAGPDEESWRRILSTPNKTFFKNPLYDKALERKPSTALRSLAHPGAEMMTESTLKQFSSATRKFISRAITRISKVDNHLTTVICQ